jgi:hypothetical protein
VRRGRDVEVEVQVGEEVVGEEVRGWCRPSTGRQTRVVGKVKDYWRGQE